MYQIVDTVCYFRFEVAVKRYENESVLFSYSFVLHIWITEVSSFYPENLFYLFLRPLTYFNLTHLYKRAAKSCNLRETSYSALFHRIE